MKPMKKPIRLLGMVFQIDEELKGPLGVDSGSCEPAISGRFFFPQP